MIYLRTGGYVIAHTLFDEEREELTDAVEELLAKGALRTIVDRLAFRAGARARQEPTAGVRRTSPTNTRSFVSETAP
jgi:hypothetical protein